MKIRNINILGAALFGMGLNAADAAQLPNFYTCTGKHVSLTLAVGSQAEVSIAPAKTTLNLKLGQKNYTYQEADISKESTLIGDLWEVTTGFMPDVQTDHASLLIPKVMLGASPIKFNSQLILTKVATPFIATPYEGVVNSSRFINVFCTASMVYY